MSKYKDYMTKKSQHIYVWSSGERHQPKNKKDQSATLHNTCQLGKNLFKNQIYSQQIFYGFLFKNNLYTTG